MKWLLYFIGAPGSGKTTLVHELTKDLEYTEYTYPFAHIVYKTNPVAIEIGGKRQPFGGTDALSMGVQGAVIEWLRDREDPSYILAEGDRLATASFFRKVLEVGYGIHLVHVDTPADVAADWRAQRADARGMHLQNQAWVRGRATKCQNLAEMFDASIVSSMDLQERVQTVLSFCDPVIQALGRSDRVTT